MHDWICYAIELKKVISIYYENDFYFVEPYVHGTDQVGRDVIVGYQMASSENPKTLHRWRIFEIEKIQNYVVQPNSVTRLRPAFPNIDFQKIHCRVSADTIG